MHTKDRTHTHTHRQVIQIGLSQVLFEALSKKAKYFGINDAQLENLLNKWHKQQFL